MTATPKEIYIVLNCAPIYRDRLVKIGNELGISVYQMNFHEYSENFKLTYKQVN